MPALTLSIGIAHAVMTDGLWHQAAFNPSIQNVSPTVEIGARHEGWSAGVTYLLKVSSVSDATVRDADYDPGSKQCRANCSTPARFEASGSVYGAYVRREWVLAHGIALEVGALAFVPSQKVTVSGWREGGSASNPVMPTGTYTNKNEIRLSPSFGVGWTDGRWHLMARHYTHVKTGGDEVCGTTFCGITGLYNGPVSTVTVGYTF